LAKAGIVRSTRGVKGGFALAKKPAEISLLNVVEAIDGPVAMNICAVDKKNCCSSTTCAVHPVWVEIRGDVENKLSMWNFAKLAAEKTPGK
jgi:Rrf2 family protein